MPLWQFFFLSLSVCLSVFLFFKCLHSNLNNNVDSSFLEVIYSLIVFTFMTSYSKVEHFFKLMCFVLSN